MSGTSPMVADLRAAFEQAASVVAPTEATVLLGGELVGFRIAGPALAEAVLRPFAPLRAEGTPVATVDLWSAAETGVALPASITPERWRIHAEDSWMAHVLDRAVTAVDRTTGAIVGHRVGVEHLSAHERTKPFGEVLALWLLDRGILKVHAGSVEGALLVGRTGAGKSTATLATTASGRRTHGDDHVAIRGREVHGLYAGIRVQPHLLVEHPWLGAAGEVEAVPGDKSMVFVPELAPPMPVRCLLAPSSTPGAGLRRLRPAEALRAVAPSSVMGMVGGGAAAFQALGDLAGSVPAYALHHGGDPAVAAALVQEALDRSDRDA